MQITTTTTPETTEVATANINENSMPDIDQQQIQSNKQVSKHKCEIYSCFFRRNLKSEQNENKIKNYILTL